jgi:hypothetical protein
VVERGDDGCFSAKAFQPIGVRAEFGREDLDSNLPPEFGVPSEIDLTHATGAELAEDSVMEEGFTQQSIRSQSLFESETAASLFPLLGVSGCGQFFRT